jgi:threonyl-tRNA synthetase
MLLGGIKIRIVFVHVDYIRTVLVHLDYVRVHTKRKKKTAGTVKLKRDSMEEGVVLFCCVEKIDEDNSYNVIKNATSEIIKRLEMIEAKKVMVYPYAHLTNDLNSPETGTQILSGLENSLKERGFEVKRSAFGWYKELEMKVKRHPLSNISITALPDCNPESETLLCSCSNRSEKKNYVPSFQ